MKVRIKLDKKDVEDALIKTDGNITKAAEILNETYDRVKWIIKHHKLQFKNRSHINATNEEIVEAYGILNSVPLMAKKFNCSLEGIKLKMKQIGINVLPFGRSVDDDFFSRDTEETFYWAGFIAADGCVNDPDKKKHLKNGKEEITSRLSIVLSKTDKDHLKKFVKDIKYSKECDDVQYNPSKNSLVQSKSELTQIRITSQKIVNDLKKFGIGPRKSLTYCPPKELILHPLFHHFLRGYFDGDGSVSFNADEGQLRCNILGSLEFMEIYKSMFEKHCNTKVGRKIYIGKNDLACLSHGGNKVLKRIFDYLYKDATIYLQRKWDKFQLGFIKIK